jgi:hypothetical protein
MPSARGGATRISDFGPVGLLDGAADIADRIDGTAGGIGALFAGRHAFGFANLLGSQIGEYLVTDIFKNESLAAVANDDPLALFDFQFWHLSSPQRTRGNNRMGARTLR